MKKYIYILFCLLLISEVRLQGIGELAPEKESIDFPPHAWGVDIMFGEGGFGFGGFYRKDIGSDLTFFTDFSISEAKDEREFEYIDYWGNTYVRGKKNRIFIMPLNFGLQYRLFRKEIGDNLRPYINFGAGPSMVVTTPYEDEFFTSFKRAEGHFTAGAYVGVGANFGLDQSRLLGINIRYYVIRFFNEGVEGLEGSYLKNLGGFYVTLNIGSMY
ncbi:MAG: hypothetical protein RBR95_02370 [Ignavibacteriaceae bacterium]|jgi:hypothetical protein|nr:hypothetical protein [Ignavibacteriaceae bacterium]HPO55699.1 hypothetical protein [Ignavibacteriaceae bacterium]